MVQNVLPPSEPRIEDRGSQKEIAIFDPLSSILGFS